MDYEEWKRLYAEDPEWARKAAEIRGIKVINYDPAPEDREPEPIEARARNLSGKVLPLGEHGTKRDDGDG